MDVKKTNNQKQHPKMSSSNGISGQQTLSHFFKKPKAGSVDVSFQENPGSANSKPSFKQKVKMANIIASRPANVRITNALGLRPSSGGLINLG